MAASTRGLVADGSYNIDAMAQAVQYVSTGWDWLSANDDDVVQLLERIGLPAVMTTASRLSALAGSLRTAHNGCSAVNRLPVEILGYIFELITNPSRPLSLRDRAVMDPTYPVLTLSRVCRQWRDVALHTPALWSLMWSQWDCKRKHNRFPTESLKRSGQAPLTVWLGKPLPDTDDPLFMTLMTQLPRICDLRIPDAYYNDMSSLPLDRDDAPMLKTLAIQCTRGDEPANVPQLCWRLPNAENVLFEGFTGWIYTPWTSLRCLCIAAVTMSNTKVVGQFLDVLVIVGDTLEDLVCHNMAISERIRESLIKYHPKIQMLALKRIVEQDVTPPLLELLTSRLDLSPGCSQQISGFDSSEWFMTPHGTDMELSFPDRLELHSLPCTTPERMLIRGRESVGVRGSSAFYVGKHHPSGPPTSAWMPTTGVTELWLCSLDATDKFGHTSLVAGWQAVFNNLGMVRTLVLTDTLRRRVTLSSSMGTFMRNFPILEELHVQAYKVFDEVDLDWLAYSLKLRLGAGLPVPRVVVFLGPDEESCVEDASKRWQEWREGCLPEVTFELIIRRHEGDPRRGPPTMAVPEYCKRSPRHTFWDEDAFISNT